MGRPAGANRIDRGVGVVLSVCIETASAAVGVAIGDHTGVIDEIEVLEGRRHAETVIPAADELLRRHGFTPRDITHIGIDIGPGLFTGLRVGLGAAKALAMSGERAVFACSSLELLAWESIFRGEVSEGEELVGVVDARREELYAARFAIRDGAPQLVVEAFAGSHVDVVARSRLTPAELVVGDAHLLSGVLLQINAGSVTRPMSSTLARVVADSAARASIRFASTIDAIDALEVLYIRAADADVKPPSTRATIASAQTITGVQTIATGQT